MGHGGVGGVYTQCSVYTTVVVEVLRRETYLLCLRLSSSTTHYHRRY
jgi:hypothetical protein